MVIAPRSMATAPRSSSSSIRLPQVMARPSTSPPPIVPIMLPSLAISILLPTPRGDEPCLAMMVAMTSLSLPSACSAFIMSPGNPSVLFTLFLTSMICAMTATAISSGVSAPIRRPIGAYTLSRNSFATPSSASVSMTSRTFFRLPIIPI